MNEPTKRGVAELKAVLSRELSEQSGEARWHPRGLAFVAIAIVMYGFVAELGAQESKIGSVAMSALPSSAGALRSNSEAPRQELLNNGPYRLCASDSIAVTFGWTPEFNQTVSVQPDGYVSLQGAAPVFLEGLTTQEAVDAVRSAYSAILREPLVTITLKDFNRPFFIVNGEVKKPEKYELRGYTAATEAVAMAGGFNAYAGQTRILLFRRENDDWYGAKTINLKQVLEGRRTEEDAEVRAGDMILVPKSFGSKVRRFSPFGKAGER